MHSSVSNHNESARKDGEPDNIIPQTAIVEPEGAEYGGAWDFDVETVFVIDQSEILDLIDN